MTMSSVLAAEHFFIKVMPPVTDAFMDSLRGILHALPEESGITKSFVLKLTVDGNKTVFDWTCGEPKPEIASATQAFVTAKTVDVNLHMLCDGRDVFAWRDAITAQAAAAPLRELVHCVSLIETEELSSLSVCGMVNGAWSNDDVRFIDGESDVMHKTGWINSTQKATFEISRDKFAKAYHVLDELEERLDIDVTLNEAEGVLTVDSVYLTGFEDVEFYREKLQALSESADCVKLRGAMSPDNDTVYALLRFVYDCGTVKLQTATAR